MARVRTETAARVRRVVSRGLLVVGGVVAGTAAAWLLSSATASAETQPDPGLGSVGLPSANSLDTAKHQLADNPLARNASKAVNDVDKVVKTTVHGITAHSAAPADLSTVVGDLDATLHGENAGKANGLGALGDKAKEAFNKVGADLAEKFGWRTNGSADVPSEDVPPVADGQPGDSSPIVGPAAHAKPVVGPRAAIDFTAPALQDRLRMGGLNRGSPVLPDPLHAPVSPLPAPMGTSGHSSSSAGGQDGPAFGALPLNGFRTVLAVIGTSRPAVAGAPVHTGAQPGNTPD